jgi:hypothetical protein
MKYKNLSVLFKDNPYSEDEFGGTHLVDFKNAKLTISGDHLIITEYNEDDDSSITGKLYKLNTLDSYKANNN